MLSEPLGRDWQHPYRVRSVIIAVAVARQEDQKIWAKLHGHEAYTYEVWPGGRNVAWQDVTLQRWKSRSMSTGPQRTKRKELEIVNADQRERP